MKSEEVSCAADAKSGVKVSLETKVPEAIDSALQAVNRPGQGEEWESDLLARYASPIFFDRAEERGSEIFLKDLGYLP